LDGVGRELKQIDNQSLPGTFSLSGAQADFAPGNFWSLCGNGQNLLTGVNETAIMKTGFYGY
jgi:hypothetical protein